VASVVASWTLSESAVIAPSRAVHRTIATRSGEGVKSLPAIFWILLFDVSCHVFAYSGTHARACVPPQAFVDVSAAHSAARSG
jgi:hypothetical protein